MKVFNEKETAEILKTAAENSHKGVANENPGLTLPELEQVAKAAGINPSEIRKAVDAMESKRQRPDRSFWGGPFSSHEQIQIDHEITAAEWEDMLVSIREFFRSKGEVYSRESVFEWTSPRGTSNSAHITAVKNEGKTRVSIGWTGPLTALPFYLPIPLVGIASLPFASEFLGLGAVPGMSLVALSVGLTFVAGRWALRRHLDKGFAKLRGLAATLQRDTSAASEQLGELAGLEQSTIQLENTATEPLLDLESEGVRNSSTEVKRPDRSRG